MSQDAPEGLWQTSDPAAKPGSGVAARLRRLEPLTCLALGAHAGAVEFVGTERGLTRLAAAALLAVLGLAGLLGWRPPWAAVVRAAVVLVTGYILLALRQEGSGYFLLWFFVLVAVYPLVLPRRTSLALIVVVPLAYLLLLPLDAADGPAPVAALRAVSLGLIGLFVHLAATAYREAVSHRDSALAVLKTYTEATPVGLGFWDTDLRYRGSNTALAGLVGLPSTERVGGRDDPALVAPVLAVNLRRVVASGEPVRDVEITSADRIWIAGCFPVRLGDRLLGVGAVATDITEGRRSAEAIARSATHDALTGLPNRLLFTDRLAVALALAERSSTAVAVLLCDLDRIRVVNDSLGHGAGDQVVGIVAERLATVVGPGDTLARLGGDEFAILRTGIEDLDEALTLAERVCAVVREPMILGSRLVTSTISVGVTVSTPTEKDADDRLRDADDLLRDADVAMYQAKDAGRDRVAVFDARLRQGATERLELHGALRRAVASGEITVAYQPVLPLHHVGPGELEPAGDPGPDDVLGLEALARWTRPGHGDVPPSVFIPLAEDLGLIQALGEHVLRTACTDLRGWREATGRPLTVAVNLSALQLTADDFVGSVAAVLQEVGLPASALVLEVTESVLMLDVQNSLRRLGDLRALGVHLAVDDFGTGYSSLAYLRDLPVDILKIDRSFTNSLPGNEELFVFMVELTQALGAQTVVEGVETRQQLDTVTRVGCDQAQGFYLSRPLSPSTVTAYLGLTGHAHARRQPPSAATSEAVPAVPVRSEEPTA